MFERFTNRARRVVVLAQEEARMLDHEHIGTEHILLGVLHEGEGVGARTLASMNVSLRQARAEVEAIVGRGDHRSSGHIPFTPRAKKVLELSLREALQLGHNYIGTEHILLGLVREGQGVAAQVLGKLGADMSRLRGIVIDVLQRSGPEPGGGEPADPAARLLEIAERGRRVREAAGRLAQATGNPSVTAEEIVFGFLAGPERLVILDALAEDPGELRQRVEELRRAQAEGEANRGETSSGS